MLRIVLMGGAACMGLLSATPAFAQTTPGVSVDDDIVVTARRREESVREVPASVSAVSGEQMEEIGAESFADYIQTVPGAFFNEYQAGRSHVVLRGIATSSGNEQGQGTVGYYINDVPLTEPGWTIVVPDVDTFDVERVEVLRGPQGSLFGSASLGGVVNYVANTADTGGFDAALEATVNSTENADTGGGVKGMINVPITNTLAVRGTYGYRLDSGYLDNIGTGEDGANDVVVQGGRLSVVWTPDTNTEISYLGLLQTTEADDGSYRNPALGDLVRTSALPETTESEVELHSLRLQRDMGFATLTAVAAITHRSEDWVIDFDPLRPAYNADLDLNLPGPLYILSGGDSDGQSFEARLASNGDGPLQWLVGAFYFKTDKYLYEALGSEDAAAQFDASSLFGPGSGAVISPDGEIFNAFYSDVEGEEVAVFGEVSYEFAPRWTASVGGRFYRTEVSTTPSQAGFSTFPAPSVVNPTYSTEDEGFSPKVTLEYEASDDLMFYALVSKGFRFGQPNSPTISAYPIPAGSTSDELINYEIGMRARPADNLIVDITAFHVDWSDIQLRLQTPDFFNYAGNGGTATSSGLEIASTWAITSSFEWRTALTLMAAELTEDVVVPFVGTAPEGTQLPGSAEIQMSNVFTYSFGGAWSPTALLSHRFVSQGASDLFGLEQGDYNLLDARFSVEVGPTRVSLFANNLTDERGVTRSAGEISGLAQGVVRPRTLGVTFGWALN
ncbi:MAG TPA: TonB-dependent receptor [Verrucomicrobiae bacterium]|nr:TonB-dependent receptor [Verrucomicrobiae bacterium]